MSNFIRTYGGNTATMRHSGLAAIRRALDAGLTLNQIRNQASREGVSFGSGAQAYLAARPASSFISQYGGNEETFAHSGLEAVRRAEQAGLSIGDIRRRASQEGISFGTGAQNYFSTYDQQQQIQQQQQQFQQQLAAQQQQAEEAQRQLMISLNRPDRAPAEVKMAEGTKEKRKLRKRGTTGYFGRQGLRIGSLNVPTPGMQMSAGAAMQPATGTFV